MSLRTSEIREMPKDERDKQLQELENRVDGLEYEENE